MPLVDQMKTSSPFAIDFATSFLVPAACRSGLLTTEEQLRGHPLALALRLEVLLQGAQTEDEYDSVYVTKRRSSYSFCELMSTLFY